MSDKMSLIRANLRKIAERYNPDHDLFDERIQVNYVDAQLGVAVGLLAEEVEALKAQPVRQIDITRLEIKPGDILTVKFHEKLSKETFERIRSVLKSVFTDNTVIVIDGSGPVDFGIFTPAEAEKGTIPERPKPNTTPTL